MVCRITTKGNIKEFISIMYTEILSSELGTSIRVETR